MATITQNKIDQTVLIFDSFYNINLTVNANEYDVVNSYFVEVSDDEAIAANFTSFMFYIAQESGVSVLSLLEEIKGTQNTLEMNALISYYLNTFKSKQALYGVGNIPNPNQAVQRNVVL